MFYYVLFCSALFCSVLLCSVLFCSVLVWSGLVWSVLFSSVLFYVAYIGRKTNRKVKNARENCVKFRLGKRGNFVGDGSLQPCSGIGIHIPLGSGTLGW